MAVARTSNATNLEGPGHWANHPDRACAPGTIPDPDLFFPTGNAIFQHRKAVAHCNRCPVKTDCADYALTHPGLHGIWGGTTEADRDRLHRRHLEETL